jgi:tRNA pseudouridine55 synthase
MDGILNLNKPSGLTSHDVVSEVRRLAGQRRVGHAGTLDPLATGVLVVCLGRATRMVEYLMDSLKTYVGTIGLGVTTDTYDAEGLVVSEGSIEGIDQVSVERELQGLRGEILQIPPMYSALKRNGKPLYKLAREGVTVERDPRPVHIHSLEVVEWAPPDVTIRVVCSPGTYIRSLAHDLGQGLGCGAHLKALTRLASGDFGLDDSTPLADLSSEKLLELLQPLDAALSRYPALHLSATEANAVLNGKAVGTSEPSESRLARAYGPDGTFLAVLEFRSREGVWHPRKVFHPV